MSTATELTDLINQGVVWYPNGERVTDFTSSEVAASPTANLILDSDNRPCFAFGNSKIDSFLATSPCSSSGAVHEFFFENELSVKTRGVWFPSADIVGRILAHTLKASAASGAGIFWLGEQIFPTPFLLGQLFGEQSDWESFNFFVNPDSKEERHSTAVKILRSGGVFALVMDGSKLNLKATRQLQLAAEKGGAFCFLLRPPWEINEQSAARTKWKLSVAAPAANTDTAPQNQPWSVELHKARGAQAPISWIISGAVDDMEVEKEKLVVGMV